jgi:hypothetical protein
MERWSDLSIGADDKSPEPATIPLFPEDSLGRTFGMPIGTACRAVPWCCFFVNIGAFAP